MSKEGGGNACLKPEGMIVDRYMDRVNVVVRKKKAFLGFIKAVVLLEAEGGGGGQMKGINGGIDRVVKVHLLNLDGLLFADGGGCHLACWRKVPLQIHTYSLHI